MKKILIGFGVVLVFILITWGVLEVAEGDYYNYQCYVLDVRQDDRGNTIISTLSGQTQKSFVLRWYSREKYDKDSKTIEIGDRISLTTTHYSDTDIKKMSVSTGYSTVGKLVYVHGLESPFILATSHETGVRYLVSVVSAQNTLEGIGTGDTVRLFHKTPINISTVTMVIEAVNLLDDGCLDDLSTDDIAFIESEGYKMREG